MWSVFGADVAARSGLADNGSLQPNRRDSTRQNHPTWSLFQGRPSAVSLPTPLARSVLAGLTLSGGRLRLVIREHRLDRDLSPDRSMECE